MAAMGLGSWLSKFFEEELLEWFIKVELLLGLIGGASVPILYFFFDRFSTDGYQILMLGLTGLIGVLTGFEVPFLVRIMKTYYPLKSNLANVLSLDYVGALVATLLFPFLLIPFVGVFRTSLIFGLANVALGLIVYRYVTQNLSIKRKPWVEGASLGVIVGFAVLLFYSNRLLSHWEDSFYKSQIIFSKQTPYQQLVMTQNKHDLRLYINRIIQFSSLDEYRYHESLAQIPLSLAPSKKKILVLGGGEGLLARELLRHPKVEAVSIVDLDPEVFRLGKENPQLRTLNASALTDPRTTLLPQDAMQFLKDTDQIFDIIIADLPDPSNDALARLYSTAFFKMARQCLSPDGVFVTQATGTFHTNRAFWCIVETLKASGFETVYPYHAYVPSFGDWGFAMASMQPLPVDKITLEVPCRFLEKGMVEKMFYFEQDIAKPDGIKVNYLDRPSLLEYFLEDWEIWRKERKS